MATAGTRMGRRSLPHSSQPVSATRRESTLPPHPPGHPLHLLFFLFWFLWETGCPVVSSPLSLPLISLSVSTARGYLFTTEPAGKPGNFKSYVILEVAPLKRQSWGKGLSYPKNFCVAPKSSWVTASVQSPHQLISFDGWEN